MAKKIVIYSTPTCVYCKMAKAFFQEKKITFEDHDVAADEAARKEMMDKSHQLGVPVIDIDGEIFVGFDKGALSKALNL